jgi:hypothetical protein
MGGLITTTVVGVHAAGASVGVSGGGMVSTLDTPDPDVVYSGSGNKYYAYATGTTTAVLPTGTVVPTSVPARWTTDKTPTGKPTVPAGGISVTPLYCNSGGCGVTGVAHIAMVPTNLPSSITVKYGLQAPSVAFIHGQWVMYYAGLYASSGKSYAIYDATSQSATVYFTTPTTESPIMYQASTRGSTDPSVFIDNSGNPWLQWKSSTYTTNTHPLMANLWSMRLTTTGLGVTGSASVLLTQQTSGWAAATIENPELIDSGGTYYLFFSGGHWNGKTYAEGYVTCSGPTGGCGTVQSSVEFLHNTTTAPYGPGGASLFPVPTGKWLIAYHGWNDSCTTYGYFFDGPTCGGSRQLYVSLTSGLTPTPMPMITSFTASPSLLTTTGGTVTFSVISPNMTNYWITSSPSLTGLPAETPTVHIPANHTTSPITYTFTVTTSNDVGIETKTASVTEAADGPAMVAYENGNNLPETCVLGGNGAETGCSQGAYGFASGAQPVITSTATGTAMVAYKNGNGLLETCAIGSNGAATGCSQGSTGFASGAQPVITSTGSGTAMVAFDDGNNLLETCAIGSNGAETGCSQGSTGFASGAQPVITSTATGTAMVAFDDGNNLLETCAIGSNGAETGCSQGAYGFASGTQPVMVSTGSGTAMVAYENGSNLPETCAIGSNGAETGCSQGAYGFASGAKVALVAIN